MHVWNADSRCSPAGRGTCRSATRRLRRTITWSYDLLTPAEQKLFRRLSVFVGGCTLEAVEAVCNTHEDLGVDVLQGVASLVDNSLLVRPVTDDSVPRFFMLETFREYARERLLQSVDADETARAHAAYVLVLAEEAPLALNPPEREPWLRTCDSEHDNIRAASQVPDRQPERGMGASPWRSAVQILGAA